MSFKLICKCVAGSNPAAALIVSLPRSFLPSLTGDGQCCTKEAVNANELRRWRAYLSTESMQVLKNSSKPFSENGKKLKALIIKYTNMQL